MQDELPSQPEIRGILIHATSIPGMKAERDSFLEHARKLGIDYLLEDIEEHDSCHIRFRMRKDRQAEYIQAYDTLQLCETFKLRPQTSVTDLEREIFLSMLSGPETLDYPNYAELAASVRIRIGIVEAARRTALAFHTSKIERPADYWIYSEERGFTLKSGKPFIEALLKATQPEMSGQRYAFSCYRATEYVILLAIAQEARISNPTLLQQLQQQWESRAIMSRKFHEIFLREFGSMSNPLPHKFYIPGDRLWFRNPDKLSADIDGYEGSWVFYLGNGLFSNFWERDKPFTLASKCLEIYHWRHGVTADEKGNLQMDETAVADRVSASMNSADETRRILDQMLRLRDPQEVNADGGCIDASREFPRFVCHGSSDIFLPEG